jgi:hypothetical protein
MISPHGPPRSSRFAACENFGRIGYTIIGVVLASCLLSATVYKWKRFEEPEIHS